MSNPTNSQPMFGNEMSNLTGIRSLSPGLWTNSSEWRSTVMKVRNSDNRRKKMKQMHATDMQAPGGEKGSHVVTGAHVLGRAVSSCPSVSAVSTKSIHGLLIHEKAPPLRLTNHQSKTT